MLLIEGNGIKKDFGDRRILDIENIRIYSEDRIGIVGPNGVGKTTLIHILGRQIQPDEGSIALHGDHAFISQLEDAKDRVLSPEWASKYSVPRHWHDGMSGGERTRFKIAHALGQNPPILFADEPTSNLDMEGIEFIERQLEDYKGALILISHDRSLLNGLTNKIFELQSGRIKVYPGNYQDYVLQKNHERERAQFEYQEYIHEKKRLKGVLAQTKQASSSIKGPPKRMGNSEARLHKMGGQKAKATLERAAKNVQKRIQHLEVKEKPREAETIKLDLVDMGRLHGKIIIEGKRIHKAFGDRQIFHQADFNIYNGAKVALIGPNGSGKSTLIKMIMAGDTSIRVAKGAKIGYFSQDLSMLEEEGSILENVMSTSIYPETFVRTLLARLLFKKEDVYKRISVLSGGERVKVSFAKVIVQDINMLILDEPTNYMDIPSIEVMEEVLRDYKGTLLLVTHDRSFIHAIADHIISIHHHKLEQFIGSYQHYLEKKDKFLDCDHEETEKQIIILENRLAEIMGRLSMPSKEDDPEALDREYHDLLARIKELKNI